MSTEMGQEKIATRAIIIRDGKVLLGKRGRGIGQNQFALIGGKPDGGETPEQAVVREVEEEVGLKFENLVLWMEESNDQTIPGETWHTYYFLGVVRGDLSPKADEVSVVINVGPEDLAGVDIAFNHKEVLAKFFEEFV